MNENNEQSISINNAKTILPARGHIVKLKFNTGKVLNVNKNDIVVFVGPNNVGKANHYLIFINSQISKFQL